MADITVRRMDECGDIRLRVARVFVDAYAGELASISRDSERLARAFAHSFVPELFYVAFMDGEVVGILGCTPHDRRAMPLSRRALCDGIGFVRGTFIYLVMRGECNHPLPYEKGAYYIESVGTASAAQGKGVCTALFRHILRKLPASRFVLEVVDTNKNAIRLYEKLGFAEFTRKAEKHPRSRGFSYRIYMEHEPDK